MTLQLTRDLLPGTALDEVGPTLVRRLAGPRCADLLGVGPPDQLTDMITRLMPVMVKFFGGATGGSSSENPMDQVFQALAYRAMLRLAETERQGKDVKFRIPVSLRSSWETRVQRMFLA